MIRNKLGDSFRRYTFLRMFDIPTYKQILKEEFDGELLLLLLRTFKEQVLLNPSFQKEQAEHEFIHAFLAHSVAKTPNFDFVLEFFTSKEKEVVGEVVKGLVLLEEQKVEEILKVFKVQ